MTGHRGEATGEYEGELQEGSGKTEVGTGGEEGMRTCHNETHSLSY